MDAFRGTFFFFTSMELKTKGAGGGGAGHEMIDSNTSWLSIFTPRHFLAVSAICFELLVLQMCHVICVSETSILCMGLGGKMIASILRDILLAELMVKRFLTHQLYA